MARTAVFAPRRPSPPHLRARSRRGAAACGDVEQRDHDGGGDGDPRLRRVRERRDPESAVQRVRAETGERERERGGAVDQRQLEAAVLGPEPLGEVDRNARDEHDQDDQRRPDRTTQTDSGQQAAPEFAERGRESEQNARPEAELLEEAARPGERIAAELPERFLAAVGGDSESDEQPDDEKRGIHEENSNPYLASVTYFT